LLILFCCSEFVLIIINDALEIRLEGMGRYNKAFEALGEKIDHPCC
jgi:hypothetical protein